MGAETTEFVWNRGNIVYTDNGTTQTVYRYGMTILASNDGTATYTYLTNAHGDVIQLRVGIDIAKTYTYDAFGNETAPNSADTNPFRYTGQYYDTVEKTYYLRARNYDPATGRFTQQDGWEYADPNNIRSLNLYTYCWNDPVRFVDMTGNWPTWGQIGQAVLIAGIAALSIAAIVATAGAAGAAIGMSAALVVGTYGTTAAAISTVATIGAYTVAGGIGLTAASDIGEVFTGHNVIRDDLLRGNQQAYDITKTALNIVGICVVQVGTPANTIPDQHENIQQNKVSTVGAPFIPGQRAGTIQIGVDPNTLISNGRTLLPEKMTACMQKCKETGGIYGTIEVYNNGIIHDGHHRVAYAQKIGAAVDVVIVPGR